MFLKIVTIVFWVLLALFFFGIAFPFLKIILGTCAAILAIAHLQ